MSMSIHERDDNEVSAGYYDGRIRETVGKLIRVGQSILQKIEDGKSLTYAQFLELKREFEDTENSMRARDILGMHSQTGKDRFRHIAHPDQYPDPAVKEPAMV